MALFWNALQNGSNDCNLVHLGYSLTGRFDLPEKLSE